MKESTKRKISKANKGKKNGFYGKTHTKEVRERIRLSKLGRKNSAKRLEVREKIRKSKIGKRLSKYHKKRISEGMRN